jgi:membrane protein
VSAGTANRAGGATRAASARRALAGAAGSPRARFLSALWALTRETVNVCLRYRVTGLASEAGFFALLSLPPLILGLVAGIGYVGSALGPGSVDTVRAEVDRFTKTVFASPEIVRTVTESIDQVLQRGRLDIISIAFVLSLWSGSRVLNVFIDTISIMYGQGGQRGIIRTRALSFSLYVVAVLLGAIVLPLVLLGPSLLDDLVPDPWRFVLNLYWPVVTLITVASLASLYHVATPQRSRWVRGVPGAVLALVIWVGASYVLRAVIGASANGTSIYGPLAASIVVLIWLYFLAIAVLIGAALNAAARELWPPDPSAPRSLTLRGPVARSSLTPLPAGQDDEPAGQPAAESAEGRVAEPAAEPAENQVTGASRRA